jgi:elongation factor P
VGDALAYLREGDTVSMQVHEGTPVGVELPSHVILSVADTGAATRGDTVSNVFKDATLETGHTLKVPLYVDIGERVKVDTRTGEFVERV